MNSLEPQSAAPSTAGSEQNNDPSAPALRCANCRMRLPAGARFCLNCGHPVGERTPTDEAHLFQLVAAAPEPLVEKVRAAAYLTGERRLVTAIFVDVVGSTELSAQVGAATWSAILDKMGDWLFPIIYRYEGTIARFVGDELLAFFGAPVAHEDDPVRAVHAALEILAEASQAAAEVRREFAAEFAVRISLSTGPVTIGPVSSDLQFAYSALEGTLNLAAQLEATKRAMAVLISEETYRLVAPFFHCADLGTVTIEGQSDPVHIYQVTGGRADAERGRELESPFVGRKSELQHLLQLSEAVTAGLGRTVLIAGEPGIGKTRLVAEWREKAAQHVSPSPQWAEGHCVSYKQVMAYHLLRDLLRSLIGVSAAASEPETRAALYNLCTELFAGAAPDVYPYLGHLLSLAIEDEAAERIKPLDPPALQAKYVTACRRLLGALTARGPLILLLEDLQWADPSSTAILSQLLPLATASPLLFCLVTRPERGTPGWNLVSASRETMGGRFSELRLRVLTERDSRQMIANLLQIDALPKNVPQLILKRAEGNPFFIEEVLRMMIDQGVMQRRNGGWTVGREIGNVGIPDSLQGLLVARLDRLPDDARQILRVAAVIGRRFPVPVLETVIKPHDTSGSAAGQDDDAVAASQRRGALINLLGRLESSGLISVFQVKPDLTYRFQNTLLQDAVYASLLPADRERLHLAVGEAMEALYAGDVAGLAPQLAHHFHMAGDTRRAFKYFVLAGDNALGASANQEAETRYRQALDLAPGTAEQASLMDKLGQALFWQSRFEQAIQTWGEGIALFQTLGDIDGIARLYARSARAAWSAGDTPGSLQLCQEGLAATTQLTKAAADGAGAGHGSESSGLALLLHEAARAHLFNGLAAEARRLGEQALEMGQRLGDFAVQAEALATLGLMPDQTPEEALAALGQAAALAESVDLYSQAARAHVNLAALKATSVPDLQAARDHYRRAAELHQLQGNTAGEMLGLGGMANILLDMGEFAEVETTLPVMRELLDTLASPGPGGFHIRLSEALLQRYRGELAEAAGLLQVLQREERQRGNLQNLLDVDIHLAEVLLESRIVPELARVGEWAKAETALAEAIQICDRWSGSGIRPRCFLAMVYIAQRRFDEAREIVSEVKRRIAPRPRVPDDGWPALTTARLAAAEGHWAEALHYFAAAAETFAGLGMRWQQARVALDWAEAHTARREPTDLEQARTLLRQASASFTAMGVPFYTHLANDRLHTLEVESFAQAVAHEKVDREMAAAGKIQTGLLPAKPPEIPGWQLAATLVPSRQTSGDFYDFIPLPGSRLGLVIADVADKGAAAALFMAMSSSLIRTYAVRYTNQPELVLAEINRRILAETHTDLFVTVFYAVLDPNEGTLQYSNAGHNPPLHLQREQERLVALTGSGIPVGVLKDWQWTSATINLAPGDLLVLYTDGVTDAQDKQAAFFDTDRLLATIRDNQDSSAQEVKDAILGAIRHFAGGVPQFDDIALVVLGREAA